MEANGRKFRGAVVCASVCAEEACYRADRHDVAFAGFYHVGQKRFYRLEMRKKLTYLYKYLPTLVYSGDNVAFG